MCFSLFAQTGKGTLKGIVIDPDTKEGSPLTQIKVKGTDIKTQTDFDGNYTLNLTEGVYDIVVVNPFTNEENVVEGVEVKAGQETVKDLKMEGEVLQMTIKGKVNTNSEAGAITEIKTASQVKEVMSSKTFSQTGDSEAAGASKRISGVSVEGGKYVFVRGLGDRYSKTLLNNLAVPGLDPDKNSIQLNIFPTSLLQNITILKSGLASNPADFTGGLVNLTTKGMPVDTGRTIKVSVSTAYSPSMHMNDSYKQVESSATDFLGFDDGTRDVKFNKYNEYSIGDNISQTSAVNNFNAQNSFNKTLAGESFSNFVDKGLQFSYSNKKNLKTKNKVEFGYNLAASIKNKTRVYQDLEQTRKQFLSGELQTDVTRTGTKYQRTGFTSLYGSAHLKSRSWVADFALMSLNSGTSQNQEVREIRNAAVSNDFNGYRYTAEYNERGILNSYLHFGKSFEEKDLKLDFYLSPTKSKFHDKDVRNLQVEFSSDDLVFGTSNTNTILRIWRELDEWTIPTKIDLTKSLDLFNGLESKISSGLGFDHRMREFSIFQYAHQPQTIDNYDGSSPNTLLNEDNLVQASGDNDNLILVSEFQDQNAYEASQSTVSAYGLADVKFTEKFKAVGGIRIEKFQQIYSGYNLVTTSFLVNEKVTNDLNILPSLNATYSPNKKVNLRFSYASTVSRPSMKEKSSATIQDPTMGITFNGNLDSLESTTINNFDFRFEMFPKSKEIFAISTFYKRFSNPIEVSFFAQSTSDIQPINVGDANLFGVEFEAKKNLEFLSPQLNNFSFLFNASYINSSVKMTEAELLTRERQKQDGQEDIGDTRVMQGQSPYLLNLGLVYSNDSLGLNISSFYNVQGKKLSLVAAVDNPDVYEMPFNSWNFKVKKSIGQNDKSSISFSVSNILNSTKWFRYEVYGSDNPVFYKYKPGRFFSVSYGLNF